MHTDPDMRERERERRVRKRKWRVTSYNTRTHDAKRRCEDDLDGGNYS
jgi:hypothetical protein